MLHPEVLVVSILISVTGALAVPPVPPDWTVSGGPGHVLGADAVMVDTNADGFDDVAVIDDETLVVFFGSPTGPSLVPDVAIPTTGGAFLGLSTGDFDGDGFGDLVVEDYTPVKVFRGGPAGTSPSVDWEIAQPFGFAIGDTDGDGFDELVALDTRFDDTADVYLGTAAGLPPQPAFSLSFAGEPECAMEARGLDANGDGYGDLALSCQTRSEVRVYLGGPGGLTPDNVVTLTLDPGVEPTVLESGDLEGDGYDDLVVADSSWDDGVGSYMGAVWIFSGGSDGPSLVASWNAAGAQGDVFGTDVGVGDLDGDGDDELVVGVPYAGGSRQGLLERYDGDPAGLATVPSWTWHGLGANDFVGSVVNLEGDVNGDGVADLLSSSVSVGGGGEATMFWGEARDEDGDGVLAADDCDDADPAVGGPVDGWPDADGDTYGADGAPVVGCPSDDRVSVAGDCDDADPAVSPAAAEVCNGLDDDCNGEIDDTDCATDADPEVVEGEGDDPPPVSDDRGCGCASTTHHPAWGMLLVLGVFGVRRRRPDRCGPPGTRGGSPRGW